MRTNGKEKSETLSSFQEHPTNLIAVKALMAVSAEMYLPYTKVKRMFVQEHNVGVTMRFWREIERQGLPFSGVDHCSGCGKFDLY